MVAGSRSTASRSSSCGESMGLRAGSGVARAAGCAAPAAAAVDARQEAGHGAVVADVGDAGALRDEDEAESEAGGPEVLVGGGERPAHLVEAGRREDLAVRVHGGGADQKRCPFRHVL